MKKTIKRAALLFPASCATALIYGWFVAGFVFERMHLPFIVVSGVALGAILVLSYWAFVDSAPPKAEPRPSTD